MLVDSNVYSASRISLRSAMSSHQQLAVDEAIQLVPSHGVIPDSNLAELAIAGHTKGRILQLVRLGRDNQRSLLHGVRDGGPTPLRGHANHRPPRIERKRVVEQTNSVEGPPRLAVTHT